MSEQKGPPPAPLCLSDFLAVGPCGMRNFHRPDRAPAYWCDQCRTISKTGECKREALRDA